MKKIIVFLTLVGALASLKTGVEAADIEISGESALGNTRPVYVCLSGFSGEAERVLRFDLYVQGFAFTNAEAAQYMISGSNNGNLQARANDLINKTTLVAKAYSGASIRRQVHAFVDDFVQKLDRIPIAQTKLAFKGQNGKGSEVFLADFDGFNAQAITRDGSIVAAPSVVPGRSAIYYVSYKLNHTDIFYQDISSGSRKIFARYGGSNLSPAASPDGRKVAMILSKDGWTDLYVCDADGSNLTRLTKSPQDESSPCWSPDSRWICFAGKDAERRTIRKIPVSGGLPKTISTSGFPNPSEPDWSPDGKYIAFTAQSGKYFQICVVPADGSTAVRPAVRLVEGEDPSWSPNSRTLAYARRNAGAGDYVLSLLDVPTKQYKDVSRISGSNSQSQPSWAK